MKSSHTTALFVAVFLSMWALMHFYVLWRLSGLTALRPWVSRRWIWGIGLALGVSFIVAHNLEQQAPLLARPLAMVGATWMGLLFLLVVWMLAVDLGTGFGSFAQPLLQPLRLAAVAIAVILAWLGAVIAFLPPAVTDVEVKITGLRPELEGLKLVQLSDLHLGSWLGERFVRQLQAKIEELHPDLLFITGDVLDERNAAPKWLPVLRRWSARLGVWAVTGNHDGYAGFENSAKLLRDAGFHLLQGRFVSVAPGLLVAGVDGGHFARHHAAGEAVRQALRGRPQGAVIFLSHAPDAVEVAAAEGVDLMLSGHTHGGQIWPFGYLVALRYPYLSGRFSVGPMTLLVSRGTGFWGPPMRLFQRGEIIAVTLRRG